MSNAKRKRVIIDRTKIIKISVSLLYFALVFLHLVPLEFFLRFRLNALFEQGGRLTVSERGVLDGQVPEIKPHPGINMCFTFCLRRLSELE